METDPNQKLYLLKKTLTLLLVACIIATPCGILYRKLTQPASGSAKSEETVLGVLRWYAPANDDHYLESDA